MHEAYMSHKNREESKKIQTASIETYDTFCILGLGVQNENKDVNKESKLKQRDNF